MIPRDLRRPFALLSGAAFALALLLVAAFPALAQGNTTYAVKVTNLTQDQFFSQPVVVVHDPSIALFTPGEPAGEPLRFLAEEGDTEPLVEALTGNPSVRGMAVSEAFVLPGETVTILVDATGGPALISVVGMLTQTNDGFFAATFPTPTFRFRGLAGPTPLTQVFAKVWDAGTETNTEDCDHIPGPPCNERLARAIAGAEGFVYLHNGIHGIGDLPVETYDWRHSAALVEVERRNGERSPRGRLRR